MASVTFGDELVRDYLVYRGFLTALKAFDGEVKGDKDRGFRPDRIVEHLSSCITNLDLNALREAWSHLEQRVFSRLEHSFLSTARKLENALLRMYLVTCVSASRHDKLLDFFEKMTSELQGQSDWKEWFALPFLKNADENPAFSVFFTRQWQDTMLVSLHNFISVVFQSIATPSLLSYEEELFRLNTLQEENELLKTKLSSLVTNDVEEGKNLTDCLIPDVVASAELMDDFYVIAQETPAENVGRSIKTLIKNISSNLPTSPILGRHLSAEGRRQEDYIVAGPLKSSRIKPRSPSVPPQPSSHMSASDSGHCPRDDTSSSTPGKMILCKSEVSENESKGPQTGRSSTASSSHLLHHSAMPVTDPKSGFLILSRDEFSEHNSFVTQCRFNCTGSFVASSDVDGVIKIWNASPSIQTHSTIMSKSSVFALEWAPKRERLLLHGSTAGKVRLYDTKERRLVGEVTQNSISSENQKVLCVTCSPTEANFVASSEKENQGKLCLYNMRTLQLEQLLPFPSKSICCYCCSFNHNGQLLLVGTWDGHVHIFDLRTCESIANWSAHTSAVLGIQLSSDENSCYTIGQDGKFVQWGINKTGRQLCEFPLHADATLPFSKLSQPAGKLFSFSNDAGHILTCGPLGGVIYKLSRQSLYYALSIGGHNQAVVAVDWSTAMECSTCLCGSSDGKIVVSTLMTQ